MKTRVPACAGVRFHGLLLSLSIIFLCTAAPSTASPYFSGPFNAIPAANGPWDMESGDLNGDGIDDVVVSCYLADNVMVFLGNSDGTFTQGPTVFTSVGPRGVALADLNGDTKLDLGVACYGTSNVEVRLGIGDGTFSGSGSYSTLSGVEDLVFIDVDGDGDRDLCYVSSTTPRVSCRRNNGTGTFMGASNATVTGTAPVGIAAGFLDTDSNVDLVVAVSGSAQVEGFLGNGSGSFSSLGTVTTASGPVAVSIADMDANGKSDIVVACGTGGVVTLLRQGSTPATYTRHDLGSGTLGSPSSIQIVTLDAGTSPDIVVGDAGTTGGKVGLLYATGSPSVYTVQTVLMGPGPKVARKVNFNGDGRFDLAAASNSSGLLTSALQNASAVTFGTTREYEVTAYPTSVALGDFDGNGLPDVAAADSASGSGTIVLLRNLGGGALSTEYSTTGGGNFPIDVAVSDLNNDGKRDLVVGRMGGLATLRGTGSFSLQAAVNQGAESNTNVVGAIDVSGDGLPDLLAFRNGPSGVSDALLDVFTQDSNGTFVLAGSYNMLGTPVDFATANLNGDGDPDIVSVSRAASELSVRFGSTGATFGSRGGFSLPTPGGAVAVGNLNGDAFPDIVVGSATTSQVFIFYATGSGTYGTSSTIGVNLGGLSAGIHSLAVADVDNDGLNDIVALSRGTGVIWVYRQTAPLTFAIQRGIGAHQDAMALAVGDLTSDGRVDVVTAVHQAPGAITLHLNLGGGGVSDLPPSVTVPAYANGEEKGTIVISVTAVDPDGNAISTLTANLAGLPPGNDAVFVPSGPAAGTFTWHPAIGMAGQYTVPFTASNALSGSASTLIRVGPAGTSATATLLWTPKPTDVGSYVVTFTAKNKLGEIGTATSTIVVSAPPPAPPTLAPPMTKAPAIEERTDRGPIVSVVGLQSATTSTQTALSVTAANTDTLTVDTTLLPAGNNSTLATDQEPVVTTPASIAGEAAVPVGFNVSTADPNGDVVETLTADVSRLPIGNNASFVPNGIDGGFFSWTPTASDSGAWLVTFQAANRLVGTATTVISVGTGLKAYYKLNGDGVDGAGGRTLQNSFTAGFSVGKFGQASDFTGGNSSRTLNGAISGSDLNWAANRTVECWFKARPAAGNTDEILVSAGNETSGAGGYWRLGYGRGGSITAGRLFFEFSTLSGFVANNVTALTSVTDTFYHHAAVTFDGSTMRLYLDGILTNSAAPSFGFNADVAGQQFSIGNSSQGFNGFTGQIDEVRFWQRTRTQTQIATWKNTEITGYPTGAEEVALAPAVTRLEQNHPNPFNPSTSIRFVLASAGPVSLRIFDSQGRVVRTLLSGRAPAGDHLISWDANDQGGRAVGSGVYFYRLEASGFSESRKMVLMR